MERINYRKQSTATDLMAYVDNHLYYLVYAVSKDWELEFYAYS